MGQKTEQMSRTTISYGHNNKDRVVVEFSQNVRTLFMTPQEAMEMIAEITHSVTELEKLQAEPKVIASSGGGLNG